MSIPKFKRKPNGLEYVDNAYVIQVETLRLVSKLNKKWTNIYIIGGSLILVIIILLIIIIFFIKNITLSFML